MDDMYFSTVVSTQPVSGGGSDITVTGVSVAAGAEQIELSGTGFDAAFASSFNELQWRNNLSCGWFH